ncbi:MAG: alpha/beta fold hydrolase [Myxococcota bacterium]
MSDPIVLLHGFTGAPRSWDPVVRALPGGARVVRPPLLGHGAADDASVTCFDDEVDRLAAHLHGEGVRDALLVGYSLGGRLALGLLARHPDRFARAVILGAHPGLTDPDARVERVARDERWAHMLEREGIGAFVDAWERLPLFATQARLPAAVRQGQRAIRMAHDPRGLARALRVVGLGRMPVLWDRLARVRVPARLVAGSLDAKFGALADRLAEAWGGPAEVARIEGAGHNVVLERPADVAALVVGT